MKLNSSIIIILLIALITGLFICSCSYRGDDVLEYSDQRVANEKFEELYTAIQTKNEKALISLFNKTNRDNEELNREINKIFEYFTGEVESYDDWGGPYVETNKENGAILRIMESSYDVKTTGSEYRFAIRYIVKDTENPENVGIQSVYIIELEDDTYLEYAYVGDGKFTDGINIGVPNIE